MNVRKQPESTEMFQPVTQWASLDIQGWLKLFNQEPDYIKLTCDVFF